MSDQTHPEQSDSAEDAARAFASVLRWTIESYSGSATQRVRKIADAARSVLSDYPGYEESSRS